MPHTKCKPPESSLYTHIFLAENGYSTCDAVPRITWNCKGLALSQPKRAVDQKLVGHVAIQVKGMCRSGGKLFYTQDLSLRSSAFKQPKFK